MQGGGRGGRWRKDGRAPVVLWESLPILLLLHWWTGWNTTGATFCNDLMNELLQLTPSPPPQYHLHTSSPPSNTNLFSSPVATSQTRKPSVSAFVLKHIYIQHSMKCWTYNSAQRYSDVMVLQYHDQTLCRIFLIVLNEWIYWYSKILVCVWFCLIEFLLWFCRNNTVSCAE